jgi:aryl-alcohol dehydrogenase-like predicted oxidoreductase
MSTDSKGPSRREFFRLSSGALGLSLLGCEDDDHREASTGAGGMRYRPLGNTGLVVSEVAFGAHGVDNPPLMGAALDAGINTFCTSGQYLDGLEEDALGRALRDAGIARDRLVLITGNRTRPGVTKRRILDDIDASLRRLRTDYIDVYYSAEVRSPGDLRVESLYDAFDEARSAGKVRHLGLSGHHGGMQDCLRAAIDDGRFGLFFIKYDFVSYPDQDEILRRAARSGVGSIVFKTSAGNRQGEIKDLEAGGLSFRQATIRWALSNPDVASVAITFTNFDVIRECTAAVGAKLTRVERGMLRRYRDVMVDKYCRFCGVCEESCPRAVPVADIMRFAMYFKYYHRERSAMQSYAPLAGDRSASACERCSGPCNAACPFGRDVRGELVEAHRLLRLPTA